MSSSSGNSSHSESGSPSEDRESYNYEIGPPSRKNQD